MIQDTRYKIMCIFILKTKISNKSINKINIKQKIKKIYNKNFTKFLVRQNSLFYRVRQNSLVTILPYFAGSGKIAPRGYFAGSGKIATAFFFFLFS